MAESVPKVHVALVVSGAIALGSFEAGVLSELLRAAQNPESPLCIDIIGGASAGALTGAALAYYLTCAAQPGGSYPALTAWQAITVEQLTTYQAGDSGLLSRSILLEQINSVLGRPLQPDPTLYAGDVLLFMTLCSLHGRQVTAADAGAGVDVDICYRNFSESVYFRVPAVDGTGRQWEAARIAGDAPAGDPDLPDQAPPDGDTRLWQKIFNYALTSAANPLAWPARRHCRFDNRPDIWWPEGVALTEQSLKRAKHFEKPAEEACLYFTDGGTVDNRPILKMLEHAIGMRRLMAQRPGLRFDEPALDPAAVAYLDTPLDPSRLLLFIEPDPREVDQVEDPDEQQATSYDQYAPFLAGSLRALQPRLHPRPDYTDLEYVAGVNQGIAGVIADIADLAEILLHQPEASSLGLSQPEASSLGLSQAEAMLPPAAPGLQVPPPLQAAVDAFFAAWVEGNRFAAAALQWVRSDGGAAARPLDELNGPLARLSAAYAALADGDRQRVRTQMALSLHRRGLGASRWIYVDRIAPGDGQCQPVARSLGHFGGFVEAAWMAHDYALGQRTALAWLLNAFDCDGQPAWSAWRERTADQAEQLAATAPTPPEEARLQAASKDALHQLFARHGKAMDRLTAQGDRIIDDYAAANPQAGAATAVARFYPAVRRFLLDLLRPHSLLRSSIGLVLLAALTAGGVWLLHSLGWRAWLGVAAVAVGGFGLIWMAVLFGLGDWVRRLWRRLAGRKEQQERAAA